MGKIINFGGFKQNQFDYFKEINVDLNAYISYRKQVENYINAVAKRDRKNKEVTTDQFDLLENFYVSYFNVAEKIADQMLDGDPSNKEVFMEFIYGLDKIREKILPLDNISYLSTLSKEDIDRLRNSKVKTKQQYYTIDDYIDFRDIIDKYINDLSSLSTPKTITFVTEEQFYIVTLIYISFENIGEKDESR